MPAIVEAAYKQFLRRAPGKQDSENRVAATENGLSLEQLFRTVIESEEAEGLPKGLGIGATLSDGAFLVACGALLFGRGMVPQEVTGWQRVLDEQPGVFKVSMIASLYKGGKFLRQFLENIPSQIAFDQAELVIIDASSPEDECAVIEQFRPLTQDGGVSGVAKHAASPPARHFLDDAPASLGGVYST